MKDSRMEEVSPPFELLEGEQVLLSQCEQDSVFVLTNYRFYALVGSETNVLLGLIEAVEQREPRQLTLLCKHGQVHAVGFGVASVCEKWGARLVDAVNGDAPPFAFAHFEASQNDKDGNEDLNDDDGCSDLIESEGGSMASSWFSFELARLGFDMQTAWRRTTSNLGHALCPSYPDQLLVPMSVTDADLEKVALFRSSRRFPSVVWRHNGTGAVLARCSQPEVGWLWCRSPEDEKLVRAIADACAFDRGVKNRHNSASSTSSAASAPLESTANNLVVEERNNSKTSLTTEDLSHEAKTVKGHSKGLLILDLRSYVATLGNRCARGGGAECQEYYPETEIVFMGLANIHGVRKSFQALRALLHSNEPHGFLANLESTKWLAMISSLMQTSVVCARALHQDGRAVLVHCSDGWDRTSQVVSLAELLLDPFYRTMKGFEVLVEKEWLAYGHKMADRCGGANASQDTSERCPIFLQWIDCVHQLLVQFPCHFEFNSAYLVRVAVHAYSQLFGTFLFNCQKERQEQGVASRTKSLWPFLQSRAKLFKNVLYKRNNDALWPKVDVKDLVLFTDLYTPRTSKKDDLDDSQVEKALDVSSCMDDDTDNNGDNNVDDIIGAVAPSRELLNEDNLSAPSDVRKEISQDSTTDSSSQGILPIRSRPFSLSSSALRRTNNSIPQWMLNEHRQSISDQRMAVLEELSSTEAFMDNDGICSSMSVMQQRLVEIMEEHEQQVQSLRRDLFLTRMALLRASNEGAQSSSQVRVQLEQCEIKSNNEDTSGVQTGSVASDASSWEAVDETEAKPTLWVPDHAANHCMRCDRKFWLGRRRHHCRVCGKLFCADCSSKYSPLPDEQLHYPVRVCEECHDIMYPDCSVSTTTTTTTTTLLAGSEDELEVGVEACAASLEVMLKAKA